MLFTIFASLGRVTARERLALHIAIVVHYGREFVHIVETILHSGQVPFDIAESRKTTEGRELKERATTERLLGNLWQEVLVRTQTI